MFRSPMTPASVRRSGWIALALLGGVLSTSTAYAQAAPPQQAAAPKSPYVFAGDGAMILNFIKADKTADFEMILGKLKEALSKSEKPERKQQAAGWKFFKAAEAGPNGSVIYVSIMQPAVKGADYSVTTVLSELFPTEIQALYKTYSEAFGSPSQNILNLTLTEDLTK